MVDVEALLHRRSDLSTFLVHLTRDISDVPARDSLLSIVRSCTLEARTALGMANGLQPYLVDTVADQRVVCFTETPLEHVWMMVQDIDSRQQQFKSYGLAILKSDGRARGANPVWYLDMTKGHDWLTEPFRELVGQAIRDSTDINGAIDIPTLVSHPVFRLTPFLEQVVPPETGTRKEFSWEREWRHVGNYMIRPRGVVCVLAPEWDHRALREQINAIERWSRRSPPLVDPTWGLERMIMALSGAEDD